MKFLVIGNLGSMGKRRMKCVEQCGHEADGYDIRGAPVPIEKQYDGYFICTPPDKHEVFPHVQPRFHEASVIKYQNCIPEVYPSCTMRFHPIVNQIRDEVRNSNPKAFLYHVGNNIEDWHPHEDYREKYFSKKETGGCKEIVAFENEWLTWIFGKAKVISAEHGKLSNLDMTADDYYRYTLQFDSGVIGSILIDMMSRPQCREFKLIYEGYSKYYDLQNVLWDEVYLRETQAFINAIQPKDKIRQKDWSYTVKDDLKNLELLEEIERI